MKCGLSLWCVVFYMDLERIPRAAQCCRKVYFHSRSCCCCCYHTQRVSTNVRNTQNMLSFSPNRNHRSVRDAIRVSSPSGGLLLMDATPKSNCHNNMSSCNNEPLLCHTSIVTGGGPHINISSSSFRSDDDDQQQQILSPPQSCHSRRGSSMTPRSPLKSRSALSAASPRQRSLTQQQHLLQQPNFPSMLMTTMVNDGRGDEEGGNREKPSSSASPRVSTAATLARCIGGDVELSVSFASMDVVSAITSGGTSSAKKTTITTTSSGSLSGSLSGASLRLLGGGGVTGQMCNNNGADVSTSVRQHASFRSTWRNATTLRTLVTEPPPVVNVSRASPPSLPLSSTARSRSSPTDSVVGDVEVERDAFYCETSPVEPPRDEKYAPSSSSSVVTNKVQEVRERALRARRELMDMKLVDVAEREQRRQEAATRKAYYDDCPTLQRAAWWLVVMRLQRAETFFSQALAKHKEKAVKAMCVIPTLQLMFRRFLRHFRMSRLLAESSQSTVGITQRPSVVTLRSDKILNLFSDAHLECVIEYMQLKYFFPNELIISMGLEEEEAYVLAQGSADVLMGRTSVFTLRAGMCFGTVGMVSGEPRTATVMAREACVVWVISRRDFNSFRKKDAINQDQVEEALATVQDLRRSNMLNVYKRQLQPQAIISAYPLFRGEISHQFIDAALLMDISFSIHRSGDYLLTVNATNAAPMLLLRGSVEIVVERRVLTAVAMSNGGGLIGGGGSDDDGLRPPLPVVLRSLVDLPARRRSEVSATVAFTESCVKVADGSTAAASDHRELHSISSFRQRSGSSASLLSTFAAKEWLRARRKSTELVVVAEVSGPAIINLAPMLLGYHSVPFGVRAKRECDVLNISREVLRSQDMLELATLRQNALNMRCDLFRPLVRSDVVRLLFRGCGSDVQPLMQLLLRSLSATPSNSDAFFGSERRWVYNAQDVICFEPDSEFQMHIIVSGEIETFGGRLCATSADDGEVGFLFPSVAECWFASRNVRVRAKTIVEAVLLRRSDFVSWIAREVGGCAATYLQRDERSPSVRKSEALLLTSVRGLGKQFYAATHVQPSFSTFGLSVVRQSQLTRKAACSSHTFSATLASRVGSTAPSTAAPMSRGAEIFDDSQESSSPSTITSVFIHSAWMDKVCRLTGQVVTDVDFNSLPLRHQHRAEEKGEYSREISENSSSARRSQSDHDGHSSCSARHVVPRAEERQHAVSQQQRKSQQLVSVTTTAPINTRIATSRANPDLARPVSSRTQDHAWPQRPNAPDTRPTRRRSISMTAPDEAVVETALPPNRMVNLLRYLNGRSANVCNHIGDDSRPDDAMTTPRNRNNHSGSRETRTRTRTESVVTQQQQQRQQRPVVVAQR